MTILFTGIIKSTGTIDSFGSGRSSINIKSNLFINTKINLGGSVAIDGVCLTATHFYPSSPDIIGFDLGDETRKITLLAKKSINDLVNIEPALLAGEPLDGHIVQGHIDSIATLVDIKSNEHGKNLTFKVSDKTSCLIVHKGSITIDGVSLTINKIEGVLFEVCLVHHSIKHTTFDNCKIDQQVHIETDIIGRYLQKFSTLESNII